MENMMNDVMMINEGEEVVQCKHLLLQVFWSIHQSIHPSIHRTRLVAAGEFRCPVGGEPGHHERFHGELPRIHIQQRLAHAADAGQ